MSGGEKIKHLREENNKLVAERDYAIRWASKTVEDVTADKDALIRELEQAVAFADDNRTFQIERAEKAEALIRDLVAALADRDAEIEHLKLEMDGVDNAKEEIGRLLGLTEEFRWKRISAAIHEQKRLIRELVAALEMARAFIDSNETYGPRPVNLFSDVVGALAKAKAAGYEPAKTTDEHPYSRDKLGEDC